jgi:ferrous iron transport protein A
MLTLADLDAGRHARVIDVLGDDSIAVRIMEMGIIQGEPLRVVGWAPLGDPMEVELRGYRLSLRKAEAARITIETIDDTDLS